MDDKDCRLPNESCIEGSPSSVDSSKLKSKSSIPDFSARSPEEIERLIAELKEQI